MTGSTVTFKEQHGIGEALSFDSVRKMEMMEQRVTGVVKRGGIKKKKAEILVKVFKCLKELPYSMCWWCSEEKAQP